MAPFKRTRIPAHLKPEHAGRPTDYRPEYCQAVSDSLAKGNSISAFAGEIDVDVQSVYRWMERHAEFSQAVARARGKQSLFWERKLQTSRKGAETTASIFALKNINPLEWRDIRTLQHEHNISVDTLTLEQLEAIASGAHPGDSSILNATFTRVEPAIAPVSSHALPKPDDAKPKSNDINELKK